MAWWNRKHLTFAVHVAVFFVSLVQITTEDANGYVYAKQTECLADGTCQDKPNNLSLSTYGNSTGSIDDDCSLYMAPSSIPNGGFGIYTAKQMKKGDRLEPHDFGIQFIDFAQHLRKFHWIETSLPKSIITNYQWQTLVLKGTDDTLIPGYGMLINGHQGLYNIQDDDCETSDLIVHQNDPEIGRRTDLYRCRFQIRDELVPAGHELFFYYGDGWYLHRSKILPPNLPLTKDYKTANGLMQRFYEFTGQNASALALDLVLGEYYETLISNGISPLFMGPRLRNAIPATFADVIKILKMEKKNVAYLHLQNVIKTNKWLRENGFCLDNIKSVPINTKSASQNHIAAARRFMRKGNVVMHSPVIHFSRKHLEMIYTADEDKRITLWHGHQLFLNYCFGHPSSTVLLFPYSPGIHRIQPASRDSMKNHQRQQANVGIRWSKNMTKPEWLNLSASELLMMNQKSGLMVEFYALEDIQPNDHLFLDYGTSWYNGWQVHVESWCKRHDCNSVPKTKNDSDYIPAEVFNNIKSFDPKHGVPNWIQAKCLVNLAAVDQDSGEEYDGKTWMHWQPVSGIELDSSSQARFSRSVLCNVVSSYQFFDTNNSTGSSTLLYRVVAEQPSKNKTYNIAGIPRFAISFHDKPYIGYQFIRNTFRHEIQVPEAMFPDSWKDINLHHPDYPTITNRSENTAKEDSDICGLYMAESSIPFAGLGIYTARPLQSGHQVFSSDLVLQAQDPMVYGKVRQRLLGLQFDPNERPWLLGTNYFWNPFMTFGDNEAEHVQSIIPGLGMLVNSHPGLVNILMKPPKQIVDLHRSTDPGAGAVTTYHDFHCVAKGDIEAGSELLVEYGDDWFEARNLHMGDLPLSYDFLLADDVLNSIWNIDQIRNNDTLASQVLAVMLKIAKLRPNFYSSMPHTIDEVRYAVENGTAALSVPERVRSIKWLEDNGMCIDNIRPGPSTIQHAGKGAFATRRLKINHIVAPLPLVHIRRHHLEVYSIDDDANDSNSGVKFQRMQLLMNYVLGHPESTLLFFPYSPVVNYVNHNATKANVRLQWSKSTLMSTSSSSHNMNWLERSPTEICNNEIQTGLILELVATKDIKPGDEIFLNYGSAWEDAWNKHVMNWKPSPNDRKYLSATELNERNEWIKTQDEIRMDNNPLYNSDLAMIITMCFVPPRWKMLRRHDAKFVPPRIEWSYIDGLYGSSEYRYPCKVLRRDEDETTIRDAYDRRYSMKPLIIHYTVLVEGDDGFEFLVEGIPRNAIQFVDKKYTSDQFMNTAFRHEIHIPDELVPKAWRDIVV